VQTCSKVLFDLVLLLSFLLLKTITMPPNKKIRNRRLSQEDCKCALANCEKAEFSSTLQTSLARWYDHGFREADQRLPEIQRKENLAIVSRLPNWEVGSYIMLRNNLSGTHPLILTNDHSGGGRGSLTFRELHAQVRTHLKLEKKSSLRLVPYRPWYDHVTKSNNVPEHLALPVNDAGCQRVFGTTLVYFAYVHLSE